MYFIHFAMLVPAVVLLIDFKRAASPLVSGN
jgi:hypothetical protein